VEGQHVVGAARRRRQGSPARAAVAGTAQRLGRFVRYLLAGGADEQHAERPRGHALAAVGGGVAIEPHAGRRFVGGAPPVGEGVAGGHAVAAAVALRRVGRRQGERAIVDGRPLDAGRVQAVDTV